MGVALPPLSQGAGAAVAGATPILPPQKRKSIIVGHEGVIFDMVLALCGVIFANDY